MTAAHDKVTVLQVFKESKISEEWFQLHLATSHTKCWDNDDFQLVLLDSITRAKALIWIVKILSFIRTDTRAAIFRHSVPSSTTNRSQEF